MGRRKCNEQIAQKRKLHPPMLTRRAKIEQQIATINAVFDNHLLIDKILQYSVHNSERRDFLTLNSLNPKGKGLNGDDLASIRLVNKNWLYSVSRVLKILNDSFDKVFSMSDIEDSSHGVDSVLGTGGVIDDFVSVFSPTTRVENSIIPFNLLLDYPYFVKENQQGLKNCFEKCGDLLSRLEAHIPADGGSMPFEFGQLNFPLMKTIKFEFFSEEENTKILTDAPVFGTNANGWKFLQDVLQNAPNLKHFILSEENGLEHDTDTSSLRLPDGIKSLYIHGLTNKTLKLLLTDKLPNLETLRLTISEITQDEPFMFQILERFQKQLKVFHVRMPIDAEVPISSKIIKFPLLERLKEIKLWGPGFAESSDMSRNWPKSIPNVSVIDFGYQTEALILNWIQGQIFPNVKKLRLSINNDLFKSPFTQCRYISPTAAIFKEIHISFPNLQKLTVSFSLENTAGLVYIYQHMTGLTKLHLNLYERRDRITGCQLASILLRISLRDAMAIHTTKTAVNVTTDNPHSLVNLKKLKSVTFAVENMQFTFRVADNFCKPIVSEYLRTNMPQVQKFKFWLGFQDTRFDEEDPEFHDTYQ